MAVNRMATTTGIEAKGCEDIAKRQQLGIAKYKTTVADTPLSLREWLDHAYQECLDQAVYLRRAIEEIDNSWQTGGPPAGVWLEAKRHGRNFKAKYILGDPGDEPIWKIDNEDGTYHYVENSFLHHWRHIKEGGDGSG